MRAVGRLRGAQSHLNDYGQPRRRWPFYAGLFVTLLTLTVWSMLIAAWLLYSPTQPLIPPEAERILVR
jgi:hypothetical protein